MNGLQTLRQSFPTVPTVIKSGAQLQPQDFLRDAPRSGGGVLSAI